MFFRRRIPELCGATLIRNRGYMTDTPTRYRVTDCIQDEPLLVQSQREAESTRRRKISTPSDILVQDGGDAEPSVVCAERPSLDAGGDQDFITARIEIDGSGQIDAVETAHALVRFDGPDAGRVYAVQSEELVVGRGVEADVHISDSGVSREHARMVLRGEELWVEDEGSCNGTFVDGLRVNVSKVKEGGLVQFGGNASFRYSIMTKHQCGVLERLYDSSTRDSLTGTHTRRYFDEVLDAELAYAERHGHDVTLLVLDIDHFKRVNDTHGHPTGDEVLRQVAARLRRSLRREDVLARMGGEEFVIMLRNTGTERAMRVGERARRAVGSRPVCIADEQIAVTISVGCCTATKSEKRTANELLSMADERLYQAKNSGRNRVVGSRSALGSDPEQSGHNWAERGADSSPVDAVR